MKLDDLMGIGVAVLALMIPIVAILAQHQQKMAKIFAERQEVSPELVAIRQELAAMRDQMNRQALAIDNLERKGLSSPAVPDVSQGAR